MEVVPGLLGRANACSAEWAPLLGLASPSPADAVWVLRPLLRRGRWCKSTWKLSTALAPGPSDLDCDVERAVLCQIS